jgi:hypothetical protein
MRADYSKLGDRGHRRQGENLGERGRYVYFAECIPDQPRGDCKLGGDRK